MNKWFIGIKEKGSDLYNTENFTVLEPPKGKYWADPFVFFDKGKNYLFFEEYDYQKGKIVYAELDGLKLGEVKDAITSDTHQSFPCLFRDNDGEVYMTPENNLGGELVIYWAVRFPDIWRKRKVVREGRFDDPILFKRENFYYIYTTQGDHNLRIFRSAAIDGDWELIKSEDIPNSRSAGVPFDNIRPVQDCEKSYGDQIIFKNIDTHSEVGRIDKTWYPNLTGTHTFNFNNQYVVIDGRIKLND